VRRSIVSTGKARNTLQLAPQGEQELARLLNQRQHVRALKLPLAGGGELVNRLLSTTWGVGVRRSSITGSACRRGRFVADVGDALRSLFVVSPFRRCARISDALVGLVGNSVDDPRRPGRGGKALRGFSIEATPASDRATARVWCTCRGIAARAPRIWAAVLERRGPG